LLPFCLLLGVELLLRLFDAGHDMALFVRDPDNADYYVMNPYASSIYFPDTANATKGNLERFPVRKAPGTFRIFVLGESTTAGYPYMHNGSFHRWLQYRLMHEYPDRNIEIINTALTAVNSWTVLGFGRQILDYQPDAVLIYAGHNEYYGALGVGSTSRISGSRSLVRLLLWLRQFRIVQLLQRAVGSLRRSQAIDERENLMQRMAAKQSIAYGSVDYYAGVDQFYSNMDAVCRLFSDHHIPVFLSTLVRNERGLAPLGRAGGGLSSAANEFRQAGALYYEGHFEAARWVYRKAADDDPLRFRAPDTLNSLIQQLVSRYATDVHLVDTRAVFEEHSPHGILGQETLLEHVHPNLYGYALMSDAFYQSLKFAGLVGAVGRGEMSFDTLLRRMPITRVDSLYGAYQVTMLRTRWPFNEALPAGYKRGDSPDEQVAGALAVGRISWLDAMDQVFKRAMQEGDKKTALRAAEATMLEHPENLDYLAYCGRLCFDCGRFEAGITYFKRRYRLDGSVDNMRALLLAFIRADQPENALAFLRDKGVSPGGGGQMPVVLQQIVQLRVLLKSRPGDRALAQRIATDYRLLDAPEAAAVYER
jgi:lysophospholipase L1-like esterase